MAIVLHDDLAEQGALGSMLADVRAAEIASQALRPEDFYLPKHRILFKVFKALLARDGMVDLVTATGEVQRRGIERQIGEGYIGRLAETVPSAAAVERYVKILKDTTRQRDIQALLAKAGQLPQDQALVEIERGAAALRARETEDTQVNPISDLDSVLSDAMAGTRKAIPLPWRMLSRETRALLPGTVTIICGSPGATKSFALIQALRGWIISGIPAAVYELEDGQAYHLRRAFAQQAGNGRLTEDEWCGAHPGIVKDERKRHDDVLAALSRSIDAPQFGKRATVDGILDWMTHRAKSGCRVLAVDPITGLDRGARPWETDDRFIWGAKAILEQYKISLILVSHPRKMPAGYSQKQLTLDDLAGGACYARFAQCILCLQAHKIETVHVETTAGMSEMESNRTWICFKSRNGCAENNEYACFFDRETLTLSELGKKVD